MRLVFILYAEDRDLLPSLPDGRARMVYETSYSVRGLYARLADDAALNPDTMDERRGGWGRLLALFRMIHRGHHTGFIQARGGKLFDPDEFPFLEGRAGRDDPMRVLAIPDGYLLRILEGLMTLQLRGGTRERLSYRTLDVEQIGSVYETVMGFKAALAAGPMLAIKAGKNNHTPVFVALDDLAGLRSKDRIKYLKEEAGRSLSAAQAKAVEEAKTADDLAAALDTIVDERASPGKHLKPIGSPILQPTDERRRTGSHYTPRSLTQPIVKYALEPAFDRLGANATPEEVLDLKVCDPAMGSGAFLVEACRAIAVRLVQAWEKHADRKPVIPPDEDEHLHARRLVAQRCLYGVDKNPRAVDLARLSLWLTTLAKDHEFTFLDHALKCGDSLVGLTARQIRSANWDEAETGLPLFRKLVNDTVTEAMKARGEIRSAPDGTRLEILEQEHRHIETWLDPVRLIGDAVITAFFSAEKPKAREQKRVEVESLITAHLKPRWAELEAVAAALRRSEHEVTPFHWEIEFPEVFHRDTGGFDAIVGNPPFLGGKRISSEFGLQYKDWLASMHDASSNTDLVAHFFRRAFSLLRQGGAFGLVTTNSIREGDTRESGLSVILKRGGSILRARRRLKWPGEAAVVVSIVHIQKGVSSEALLDGLPVSRISAYLVEGDFDASPEQLSTNSGKAFIGSVALGMGFTFDDSSTSRGSASSLDVMNRIISSDPRYSERIFPYIGGEEVNNSPDQRHHRYIMNLDDLTEIEARKDWPLLMSIVESKVLPEREKLKNNTDGRKYKTYWWKYTRNGKALYQRICNSDQVIALSYGASPHLALAILPTGMIYANTLTILAFSDFASFGILQSRIHEIWARFFSSSMKDDLRYTPSDCLRTFPFPAKYETDPELEAAGQTYHDFRARLMIDRDAGLTKTYNRFHARGENAAEIAELRALHAEMDRAVLLAYARGQSEPSTCATWEDLAARARPEFIEQDADEGKAPRTRFDWPAEFKDEVLARLLALNAERAAAERAAGLTATAEDEEEEAMNGAAD